MAGPVEVAAPKRRPDSKLLQIARILRQLEHLEVEDLKYLENRIARLTASQGD